MKMSINIKLYQIAVPPRTEITYNGLGLVGGEGIGYNFRSNNLVMFDLLSILLEGGVAEGGDRGELLDELFGGNLVTDEGLVLEGLDVLPLLDGDGRAGQLDGLGGRLDHGVRVGVVAAVVRAHGGGDGLGFGLIRFSEL